jgi:hypothetical protein
MCRRHTIGDTTGRKRRRRTRSPRARFGAKTDAVDEQLVAQARQRGISLVGPDGLPLQLTKLVLEGELTDHLGWVQLGSRDLMSGRTDDRACWAGG